MDGQVKFHLFSFARNKFITVQNAKLATDLTTLLHLPISAEAYDQLLQLAQLLQDLPDWDDNDIWTYSRRSPWYSSSKAYKQQIGYRAVHPVYNWIWKSTVQKKHNVFFLLLLKDRLSIRNILRWKNRVLPSYDCVLCAAPTEQTLQHLFLTCPFAQLCWNLIHLAAVQETLFFA